MIPHKLKSVAELSLSLAKAGFKEKNEGSYLGIFWYLLNPILVFSLLFLVFSDRLGKNIPSYHLYLLLGIIMFNFFQKATVESTKLIRENRWIIKSINFPREALVGGVVLKTFFSHLFEITLVIVLIQLLKRPMTGIMFYPCILLFFCIFVFGTCLILSAITVYIIDLESIWVFVSRLIWLGTPIFYAIEGQTRLSYISRFNPMYYFVTITRDMIVYVKMPSAWMIAGAAGYSLLFLAVGLFIFNKLKIKFAEMI